MSTRVTGKWANIYYGGTRIAEMDNADLTFSPEFAESRGWGRMSKVRDPIGYDWKVSATKYNRVGSFATFMALAANAFLSSAPTALTCAVWNRVGGVDTKIIEGPVWPGEVTHNLPETEHTKETLEFVAADAPTFVAGVVPMT